MGISGRRVDLHGLYPDEVDFVLSPIIEDSYRKGQTEITVIHGKGEGVLRQAVQKVISRQRHLILGVQRGEEVHEGGEGWLRISLKYKEIKRTPSVATKKTATSVSKKKVAKAEEIAPDLSKIIEKRELGREKYQRRMQRQKGLS
jgi:hypothetical protein